MDTGLLIYYLMRVMFALPCIFGNALVILAVYKFNNLQTFTNTFVVSLAVTDLCTGAIATPFLFALEATIPTMNTTDTKYKVWDISCRIGQTVGFAGICGNALNLLAISIERFIFISFPLQYALIVTKQRATIAIVVIWSVTIFPTAVSFAFSPQLKKGMKCIAIDMLPPPILFYFCMPSFFLCAAAMVCLYLKIWIIARKQAKQINDISLYNDLQSVATELKNPKKLAIAIKKNKEKSQMKVTKTMALVVGVYFLTWLPMIIFANIVQAFELNVKTGIYSWLIDVTYIIWMSNTWLNPLIYSYRFTLFKQAFLKIIKCQTN